MKVNPGQVWRSHLGELWQYSILINNRPQLDKERFSSPNEAKQKMREKVAFLRRKHLTS